MEQATIYNQCSNGKLQIKEAIANQVSRGVVDIQAPSNICEMNFVQVGNWATTQLASVIDEAERNAEGVLHKMFVLPNNSCVDFRQGAAWGQVYGDTTWIQSWCSSYPIVQGKVVFAPIIEFYRKSLISFLSSSRARAQLGF